MSSSKIDSRKRQRDTKYSFQEIALTPRHVVVVCEDAPFQELAELALQEAFAKKTIEFDKPCKLGKLEYKRPRGTAFYGISDLGGYKYGGVQDMAYDINKHPAVLKLLAHANHYAGTDKFSGVLLNFYRSGDDCIAIHCDKDVCREEFLGVLSISLGATRQLRFVHNHDKACRVSVDKPHGAVLAMCGQGFQEEHKHEMKRFKSKHASGACDSRTYLEFVDKECEEIKGGPWHASFTFRRHARSLQKK